MSIITSHDLPATQPEIIFEVIKNLDKHLAIPVLQHAIANPSNPALAPQYKKALKELAAKTYRFELRRELAEGNEEELKQLLTKKSIDNETCLFMFAPQIHFLPPGFIEDSLLPKLEEVGVLKEILETRESRSDEGQIALHEYISPSVGPGWSHGQPLTPTPLPTLQKLLDAYKKCGLLEWALLDANNSAVARWSVYHLSKNPLDVVKFVITNYFESGEQYRDMVMAIKDDDCIGGFSFTNESDSDDKAEHYDFFMKKNPIDAWKESVEKYSK